MTERTIVHMPVPVTVAFAAVPGSPSEVRQVAAPVTCPKATWSTLP